MCIDCLSESEVESWLERRPPSAEGLILAAPPMRLHVAGGGVGEGSDSSSQPIGGGVGDGGGSSPPPMDGGDGTGAGCSFPPVGGGVGGGSVFSPPPVPLPAPSLWACAHV